MTENLILGRETFLGLFGVGTSRKDYALNLYKTTDSYKKDKVYLNYKDKNLLVIDEEGIKSSEGKHWIGEQGYAESHSYGIDFYIIEEG
jgi:hypothetical protein